MSDVLRYLRDTQPRGGWTQAKLAKRAGVGGDAITKLENNLKVKPETFEKIAKALSYTASELLAEVHPSRRDVLTYVGGPLHGFDPDLDGVGNSAVRFEPDTRYSRADPLAQSDLPSGARGEEESRMPDDVNFAVILAVWPRLPDAHRKKLAADAVDLANAPSIDSLGNVVG